MDFEKVLPSFKQGKRIKRLNSNTSYKIDNESPLLLTTEDILASDWEIISNTINIESLLIIVSDFPEEIISLNMDCTTNLAKINIKEGVSRLLQELNRYGYDYSLVDKTTVRIFFRIYTK